MLYLPQPASTATTLVVGIYTITIPPDSSSPSSGDLFATWAIDPTLTQSIDVISLPLTITDNTGDTSGQTATFTVGSSAATVTFYDDNTSSGVNIHIRPSQAAGPGTYNITLNLADNSLTATAYIQLTIAATSSLTDPPAVTNGQYSVWVWPPAVTVALNSSVSIRACLYYPDQVLTPITFAISGLPADVLTTLGPYLVNNEIEIDLYTSDSSASNVYNVTVTGTWTADPTSPPPANSSFTASFVFQLTVDANYIAPNPNFLAPIKGRSYGVVGGRSKAGHTLRSFANPVQPNTPKQQNWRHVFSAQKLGWKSIGPGGSNNTPTLGVDPQTAWLMQNLTYNGILTPGVTVSGVQAQGTLGPCATPEAFMVMCQANRSSLNLPPLPTPSIGDQYLAYPSSPQTFTAGNFSVAVSGDTAPSTVTPGLLLTIDFTTTAQTTAPTAVTATAPNLSTIVGDLTETQSPGVIVNAESCSVTANGSFWIYTFGLTDNFGDFTGLQLTVTGFAHTAFNVTNATIHSNTFNAVSIANTSIPATLDTGGTGTISDTDIYTWESIVAVSPTPAATSGSITLSIGFTDNSGPQTVNIVLSATTGVTNISFPCARYQLWLSARAALSLGPGYVPFGFVLTAKWSNVVTGPNQIPGGAVPYIYEVTASDLYTSGTGKPAVTDWKVIYFSSTEAILPEDVFAAWQGVYGNLDSDGYIAFLIQAMNPADGTVGPGITCTVHYEAGTAKSIDFATSTCPFFQLAIGNQSATGAPGTTITTTPLAGGGTEPLVLFETENNGQTGPAPYTATLPYDSKTATYPPLPSWMSVTFGTSSMTTIPPYPQAADTWYTPYSVTLSGTAVAGTYTVELTGTQTTQTVRTKLTVVVT